MAVNETDTGTVIVVMGPTASGKSAVAVELAKKLDGVIINCDSMQVYRDLHVLTARPREDEMEGIPHQLYGVVPASVRFNAAQWVHYAVPEIEGAFNFGKTPILVGGTGFYVKALMEGLSEIPDIPAKVAEAGRQQLAAMGNENFYIDLCRKDPKVKEKLHPSDSQRLLRAWEVMAHTGKSIYDWQSENQAVPPAPYAFKVVTLQPDREWIYERVNTRFDQMLTQGALEEVKALKEQGLDPTLPCMKSIGVPELIQVLEGTMTLTEAADKAKQNSRHYVKRQLTWLRTQIRADVVVDKCPANVEEIMASLDLSPCTAHD